MNECHSQYKIQTQREIFRFVDPILMIVCSLHNRVMIIIHNDMFIRLWPLLQYARWSIWIVIAGFTLFEFTISNSVFLHTSWLLLIDYKERISAIIMIIMTNIPHTSTYRERKTWTPDWWTRKMLVGIAMQSCRMTCLSMTVIMHKQTIATTEELEANSDYGKQSKWMMIFYYQSIKLLNTRHYQHRGELLNVTAFIIMNTYILQHQQC